MYGHAPTGRQVNIYFAPEEDPVRTPTTPVRPSAPGPTDPERRSPHYPHAHPQPPCHYLFIVICSCVPTANNPEDVRVGRRREEGDEDKGCSPRVVLYDHLP